MLYASHRRCSIWLPALACALVGCDRSTMSVDATVTGASSSRPLEIVVSADTAGWIVPCGCTSNQSGGLLRRGAFIVKARQTADVLVVDAGGAASGTSRYDRMKFAAVLRGEKIMNVAAHNVGASEAAFGSDELRRCVKELAAPLVSANVRAADGEPIVDRVRVVTVGGRRAAITGVLSPKLAPPGLVAQSPRDAILAALADVDPRPDLTIVLAYVDEAELTSLAESLPEVDFILGGPTGQPIAPRRVGPVLLATVTNKGKFLAHLKSSAAPLATWTGAIVELDKRWPDDATQKENLSAFYRELAAADVAAMETSFAGVRDDYPPNYAVAGTAACVRCHTADGAAWSESSHAHAWKTLTVTGAHVDSSCQQCHTTGFGKPAGFVSAKRSAARYDVGCESCHGPSQTHADKPSIPTAYFDAARNQCTVCHDHENSPEFDYYAYWEQIRHGAPVAAADAKAAGGRP